jgi:DNA polymerase I-like protein with 3'-5' exonuclease and polymerase domains
MILQRPTSGPVVGMNTIYLDFETYYDTDYTLKKMSLVDYISDPRFEVQGLGVSWNGADNWFTGLEVNEFINSVNWGDKIVVCHNVKFDGSILAWKYGVRPKLWVDTKCMAMAVYGATIPSFSLAAVGELLGLPLKGHLNTIGKRNLTAAEKEELGVYCQRDVEICREIHRKLFSRIPQGEWEIMDWTLRAFIEPKLILDVDIARAAMEELRAEKERIIRECGVEKEILSSNKQFAQFLTQLGYAVPTKANKRGKQIPALAKGDAEFMAMLESDDLRLKTICEARKEAKKTMEVKRAEKLCAVGEATGGLYPFDVVFSGAKQTHRLAGGPGAGGNPQNFPRASKLRAAIKAPHGYILGVGDFSKIEARCVAFLSRDKQFMADITSEDTYSAFASRIFGRTITKADKKERQFGKMAVLGLGYGMGASHFQFIVKQQTGIALSDDEALRIVRLFRDTYPMVKVFWDRCEAVIEMMAKGQEAPFPGFAAMKVGKEKLVLPSGLEIKFMNLRSTTDERGRKQWHYDRYEKGRLETKKLYGGYLTENICQGVAGDICKEAIRRLAAKNLVPRGQVHDELLVLGRQDSPLELKHEIEKAMTDTLPWWPEMVLGAEVGVGPSWLEAKQ